MLFFFQLNFKILLNNIKVPHVIHALLNATNVTVCGGVFFVFFFLVECVPVVYC